MNGEEVKGESLYSIKKELTGFFMNFCEESICKLRVRILTTFKLCVSIALGKASAGFQGYRVVLA